MPSDIQVFVRFKEESVFAGEDIQCIITFKNVASISNSIAPESKSWHSKGWNSPVPPGEHSQPRGYGGLSSQNPRLAAINTQGSGKTSKKGHRTTASLSIPFTGSSAPRSSSWTASPVTNARPSHKHQRSVSIISLGSPDVGNEDISKDVFPPRSRPPVSHGRSASLQVHPRRNDGKYGGPSSTPATPELSGNKRNEGAVVQGLETIGQVGREDTRLTNASKTPGGSRRGSRRPTPSQQESKSSHASGDVSAASSFVNHDQPDDSSLRTDGDRRGEEADKLGSLSGLGLVTRILAGTSVTESNRSSIDLRSLSNRSQETLQSEQPSNVPERRTFPSPIIRQHYKMASTIKPKGLSETLLMGYAQVSATFSLDGALVDQAPFEEVKRKGFLGGQGGGGVVGVKTPSNTAGLLGGFSLNSIGESIGGFLGGADLSSIREMKGIASSRSIPLLSTPQSLLFVDMTLMPGEERSFAFRYTLPKGLPASYKGKAIKIAYNLNVGVQGAPGEKAVQAVRRVSIPFKVFSGVNEDGEIFGHDLMQPYVILQDTAHTEAVDSASGSPRPRSNSAAKTAEAATQDFLNYVDMLLNRRRRRQSSSATLEPPKGLMKSDDGSMAKQAIDRAVFLSKQNSSPRSTNRFEIARNGKRIATIILDRTLHRLGETVTASVDLSNPKMPCYSVRCTLESTEKVNPALALRSAASITRLSRRVYRSQSENTLFAERVVFSPSIPVSASPTLLTSGVNLDWALRFEFVTTRVTESTQEDEDAMEKDLLEYVAKDDRGSILAAVETLQCETFEVAIPITVYGERIAAGTDAEEVIGLPI